jgi:hypothetical protein
VVAGSDRHLSLQGFQEKHLRALVKLCVDEGLGGELEAFHTEFRSERHRPADQPVPVAPGCLPALRLLTVKGQTPGLALALMQAAGAGLEELTYKGMGERFSLWGALASDPALSWRRSLRRLCVEKCTPVVYPTQENMQEAVRALRGLERLEELDFQEQESNAIQDGMVAVTLQAREEGGLRCLKRIRCGAGMGTGAVLLIQEWAAREPAVQVRQSFGGHWKWLHLSPVVAMAAEVRDRQVASASSSSQAGQASASAARAGRASTSG